MSETSERHRISLTVYPDDFYATPNLRAIEICDEETEEVIVSMISLWSSEVPLFEDMVRAYNICLDRGLLP